MITISLDNLVTFSKSFDAPWESGFEYAIQNFGLRLFSACPKCIAVVTTFQTRVVTSMEML